MTETITNSIEDVLVDSLNFKLSPGASYITDRSPSCSWSCAGSQNYQSSSGGRLIRVPITSSGWLDPASDRVVMTVQDTGTGDQELRPLSTGHNFFRRIRSRHVTTSITNIVQQRCYQFYLQETTETIYQLKISVKCGMIAYIIQREVIL